MAGDALMEYFMFSYVDESALKKTPTDQWSLMLLTKRPLKFISFCTLSIVLSSYMMSSLSVLADTDMLILKSSVMRLAEKDPLRELLL